MQNQHKIAVHTELQGVGNFEFGISWYFEHWKRKFNYNTTKFYNIIVDHNISEGSNMLR